MENKPDESVTPEKAIFTTITEVNLVEFKNLLAQHKGDVDFFDENGMTALQHAAYKGSKEMVQLLLDRGANVTSGRHKYKYTALHFGALSGNSEVCKLLLDAGAKPTMTNSVGRTASQIAAFVGNHNTVTTINNYVPLSEISYYSVPQKQQTEPILPPILVEPLHKFILGVNIHPVRLARNLHNTPILLDNADKVSQVLEKLCKREMTIGSDTNEVIAFKYYYLGCVIQKLNSIRDKQMSNTDKDIKKHDIVEIFAKKLLKPGKDGVSLDLMNSFLKDCVREFPYRESTTFYQTVSALTCKDPPPALSVINCTINGQRGFVDAISYCNTCGEEKPAKKCSKCKTVQYCERECQRLHWFVHKKVCNKKSIIPIGTCDSKPIVDEVELMSELRKVVV